MSNMGNKIRDARKNAGMTQQEICEKLKLHDIHLGRTGYQAYEAGRVEPPRKVMNALAKILDTDISYFIGDLTIAETKNTTDVKSILEYAVQTLEINSDATFSGRAIDDNTRKLMISSIEQTMNIYKLLHAATPSDEGK